MPAVNRPAVRRPEDLRELRRGKPAAPRAVALDGVVGSSIAHPADSGATAAHRTHLPGDSVAHRIPCRRSPIPAADVMAAVARGQALRIPTVCDRARRHGRELLLWIAGWRPQGATRPVLPVDGRRPLISGPALRADDLNRGRRGRPPTPSCGRPTWPTRPSTPTATIRRSASASSPMRSQTAARPPSTARSDRSARVMAGEPGGGRLPGD